ncbi:Ribosomal RNA methyltransferase [Klebsormidium nitens]|uniref:rRNA methyltransferase 2, mitochondrial n=1 Tax=Klebsormidium nitens TaxID=105231 RepID=A0A0U9HKH6_KLENI|nr:Ribosomal RNA methyltransferase [Klebsormidium nitens]|eukprot:GAQ88002.1 Ribosomal RNA methyltransferase [Klebsormidium nitens]
MSNLFKAQDHYFQQAKRLKYVARSAFKLLEIQDKHHVIKHKGAKVLDLGCAPGAWLQVACKLLGNIRNGGLVVGVDIQQMRIPGPYCDKRVRFLHGDAFDIQPWHLRDISPRVKNGFTTVLSDMCPATSGNGFSDVRCSLELGERAAQLALGRANFSLDLGEADDGFGRPEVGFSAFDVESGPPERDFGRSDEEAGRPKEGAGAAGCQHGRPNEGAGASGNGNGDGKGGPKGKYEDGGLLLPGGHFVVKLLEGEGTKDFGERCKPLFHRVAWLRPQATRAASREIYLIAKQRLQPS